MYYRSVRGAEHRDESERILQAANVIVQTTRVTVLDEVGRKKITTIGAGEARVLRDGVLIHGIWKKDSPSARTRFYDESGAEIGLRPGVTWVQVVGKDAEIEVGN